MNYFMTNEEEKPKGITVHKNPDPESSGKEEKKDAGTSKQKTEVVKNNRLPKTETAKQTSPKEINKGALDLDDLFESANKKVSGVSEDGKTSKVKMSSASPKEKASGKSKKKPKATEAEKKAPSVNKRTANSMSTPRKRRKPTIKEPGGRISQDVDCSKIDKNAHYIFTFGEFGSGKTTVNGMITMLLHRLYTAVNDPIGNKEGIEVMNTIQHNLENGDFPPASSPERVYEYITSIHLDSEEYINLVFVEMSGENLEKLDKGDQEIDDFIKPYLLCPGASLTYLLVADYERVMGEGNSNIKHPDFFFQNFLSYIFRLKTEKGNSVNINRVLLILSKYDEKSGDDDLVSIVQSKLPRTYNFMKSPKIQYARVFPFSVGQVETDEDGEDYIETLDLGGSVKAIAEYLLSLYVKPKKLSIWQRFAKIIGNI